MSAPGGLSAPVEATAAPGEAQDPYCLDAAASQAAVTGAPWRRFAVFGDSLAEGLGEELAGYRSAPWADRVREALTAAQPELAYLNVGHRGLLAREVAEQQLEAVLAFAPDLVALTAGGNDLFTRGFDPDAVEQVLEDLVAPLRAAGADVVLFGLMDLSATWPRMAMLVPRLTTLNARTAAVARRHDAVYVDMWEHPICAERTAYSADMKHTSMRGHAVLAAETLRALSARLGRQQTVTGPCSTR